jgi:sugar lactone lactonase YvrE
MTDRHSTLANAALTNVDARHIERRRLGGAMKRVHCIMFALVFGCGDDAAPLADAGRDSGSTSGGDAGRDSATSDAGGSGPAVIATFDGATFELPESLAYHDGRAYLSFLNGAVVTVDPDGTVSPFGNVPIDPPGSAYGLGVAAAPDGTVYLAMAKASATSEFPAGVYRIPSAGGAGTLFASHPELYLPNDVDVHPGGDLYITADGRIYRMTGATPGTAEIWIESPLLASSDGTTGPCGTRTSPFPIGANGIEVEASRVIAGNTESGSLVSIPIEASGAAGAASTLVTNTAMLCGVDGLVADTTGFLATALGRNLVRISADGATIDVLHSGLPLRTPAGVDVGTFGGRRQAVVASPDFEEAFGPGGFASAMPNLSALPL